MFKEDINKNFFQKWSSEMAYILGFIAADGSICKRNDRKNLYNMNITNKDKIHLEKIRDVLFPNKKIGAKSNGSSKIKRYYYLQTTNKEICKDLMNLGIVPRKTYSLSFKLPKIPKNYFSDFVRGFFDGDGSVYIYKVNNTPQIKSTFVSASFLFLKEFNEELCKELNIYQKNIHQTISKIRNKVPMYSICFYVNDCDKLYQFMYQNNPSLYLLRKHKIFEKWKNTNRRKYVKQNYPSKIGWRLNYES